MFLGPHKMKMSHYFISLWYPLELGTFCNSSTKLLEPQDVAQIVVGNYCHKTSQTIYFPPN